MKYGLGMIFICLALIFSDGAFAQHRRMQNDEKRPRAEKLEQLKKMRLIEILKLNEEESVRFFARQSAHEDKTRDMMKQFNDKLDELQQKIDDNTDPAIIENITNEVLDIDQQIIKERQRYQSEQRKALTPEQFAKFLAFERNFGRQVREAVGEMYRGRMQKEGNDW